MLLYWVNIRKKWKVLSYLWLKAFVLLSETSSRTLGMVDGHSEVGTAWVKHLTTFVVYFIILTAVSIKSEFCWPKACLIRCRYSSSEVCLWFFCLFVCFHSLLMLVVQNLCFQNSIQTSDADESQTMVGFPFLNKGDTFCLCHGYYDRDFSLVSRALGKLLSIRGARIALEAKLKF